jgi:hypothetical protein
MCSSKTLVDYNQTTWPLVPEERTLEDVHMKIKISVACLRCLHITSYFGYHLHFIWVDAWSLPSLLSSHNYSFQIPVHSLLCSCWSSSAWLNHLIGLLPSVFNANVLFLYPCSVHFLIWLNLVIIYLLILLQKFWTPTFLSIQFVFIIPSLLDFLSVCLENAPPLAYTSVITFISHLYAHNF